MARNKSGGFNKLLNFIGLVDDEDTRDTYGEEYAGDSYGRKAAYTPPRQTRAATNARANTRQPAQRRLPDSGSRSRYESRYESGSRYESRYDAGRSTASSARASRGYDDYRSDERRTESRFDDSSYSSARSSRSGSRYNQPDSRYAASGSGNVPARATPQRMRVGPRSRTVMYSLHTLEDCCEVIDQLIANNTVVLTMDELDGRLLQRAVDTLSGAVFALHASIRKASDKTYLVAPMSVEINEAYDMDTRF